MNRGGDPGFVGRVGERERSQLGLWNRFLLFVSFPTKVE